MILLRLCLLLLLLAGCAARPPAASDPFVDPMASLARDYVGLVLEIGEYDEGYVDAYYGPDEWRAAARADRRAVPELRAATAALLARLRSLGPPDDPAQEARRRFLEAQLAAADTRLRLLAGERLSFAEEARGLYGVDPRIRPLSAYDPVLARIAAIVPGEGDLAERVEAFQNRFIVPPDRLAAVMQAAIAECRRRSLLHLDLPAEEAFTLEFVTGKSWSGYNWYRGGYRSLIQVNTDLPVRLSRAVDLGCHEGYPGHHAYNVLLERHLARGRGWPEYRVYPLYSPQSFIAEGSANYGIELAFPGEERLAFESRTLYPLAGLDPAGARTYLELQEALQHLSGARFTIARDFLEGRIDREQAIALTRDYQLVSRARAEQSIRFTEQYRAYVINYGLGRDLVARFVEAAGPDPAARWAAMRRILTRPTLPSDLETR